MLFAFLFLWTGLYSMFSQVFLFRELAVVFLGQEIALSVALAAWLLWTGAGAAASGDSTEAARKLPFRLAALACVMPLSALAIRSSRLLIPTGYAPGLLATVWLPFVLLAAPGWLLGAAFSSGAAWGRPARVYCWESLGALAGGVFSTFHLRLAWPLLPTLAAGGLVLTFLTISFSFKRHSPIPSSPAGSGGGSDPLPAAAGDDDKKATRRWTAFFLAAALLLTAFSRALDHTSRRLQWRPYDLLAQRETPYEHLALVRLGEKRILFENGAVSAQFPDPAAQEELVHWPLLLHPAPRRVLAFGASAVASLGEILKHPVHSVDLVMPDPAVLELINPPLPSSSPSPARGEGIDVALFKKHFTDPRLWIKGHPETYDVILQTLPEPQNAASNRLFSVEFFGEARRALRPGGVLAFTLASSENYLPPEIAYADASILRAAARAFPYVEAIPGARLIVLAGDRPAPLDPALLAGRYRARHIRNQSLVPEVFPWTLHPERRNALRLRLQDVRHAKTNSDLWPVSLFQVWRVWLAKFIEPAQMLGLVAALLAGAGLARWVWRRGSAQFKTPEAVVLLSAGFAGMSLEIVLLFMFQAVSGSLYWQLGVLFAAFMGGLACGSAAGVRLIRVTERTLGLASAAGALAALCAALAWKAPPLLALPHPLAGFSGLLALAGLLVGAAFPFALSLSPGPADLPTGQAGSLYAADLWGSALGAFFSGLFLIPLAGHQRTLAVAALSLALALLFFFTSRLRRTPRS